MELGVPHAMAPHTSWGAMYDALVIVLRDIVNAQNAQQEFDFQSVGMKQASWPIGSMYAIYGNIYH